MKNILLCTSAMAVCPTICAAPAPQAITSANLHGIAVAQASAYDSRYRMNVGFAATATRNALERVNGGINAERGDATTGVLAHLAIDYRTSAG